MAVGDFTQQAVAYAARPTYPAALVDRLLARAGVTAGDRVADLGAGTGIFTALLAARELEVVAVEPGAAMRAQAAPHPRVSWQAGTFEDPGLAPRSVRWITAAQSSLRSGRLLAALVGRFVVGMPQSSLRSSPHSSRLALGRTPSAPCPRCTPRSRPRSTITTASATGPR